MNCGGRLMPKLGVKSQRHGVGRGYNGLGYFDM